MNNNNELLFDLNYLNDSSLEPVVAAEVPRFLQMLYIMVGNRDCDSIVRWAHDGTALEILNVDILSSHILPKYFSVQKFTSFQRQLNYFGFRKWTKTQTDICTFSHPDFLQYEPERIRQIRRGKRSASPRKSSMYTTPVAKSITTAPSMSWESALKNIASVDSKKRQVKRSFDQPQKSFKKQKSFDPNSLLLTDDILDFMTELPDDAGQFLLTDGELNALEIDTGPFSLNDSFWIESPPFSSTENVSTTLTDLTGLSPTNSFLDLGYLY